jgi:hypothetical protein
LNELLNHLIDQHPGHLRRRIAHHRRNVDEAVSSLKHTQLEIIETHELHINIPAQRSLLAGMGFYPSAGYNSTGLNFGAGATSPAYWIARFRLSRAKTLRW